MVTARPVNPAALGRPIGYANGVLAGELLFVAGQIGALPGPDGRLKLVSRSMVAQFAQALKNVVAVVVEAGGTAEDIMDMTVFVVRPAAYRRNAKALGAQWREVMGKHFPAIAVVGVTSLYEPGAVIELKAVAHLGSGAP